MMTAYAVEDQLRRAMDAQAFAVVHKPFQVRYLLGLVEGAADQAS
jgi:CheY-like chemotaxis protein